jgi:predicted RNA polymerase sigma factor
VTAALRRLPARQRQVITLRVLLDLDTETTARVLGISPGTVRAHLHRAIAAMRSEFGPAQRPAPQPAGQPAQGPGPWATARAGGGHPAETDGRSPHER